VRKRSAKSSVAEVGSAETGKKVMCVADEGGAGVRRYEPWVRG